MGSERESSASSVDENRIDNRASFVASEYSLFVVGTASLLYAVGALIGVPGFPASDLGGWAGTLFFTSAAGPITALVFWVLVSRWESTHGLRVHRGAAALMVAIAVLFVIPTLGSDRFSLFYAVFLFMIGVRTRVGGLTGFAFLAVLAWIFTGGWYIPGSSAVMPGLFAAACLVAAFHLRGQGRNTA